MIDEHTIELFVLKCAVIEGSLRLALSDQTAPSPNQTSNVHAVKLGPYIRQFDAANRLAASQMASHYQIFYMLENDIRRLISETLEAAHGDHWWANCVPQGVREEVRKNQDREDQAGVTLRSDVELDYTTFGQLGDIIRSNWGDFAGMMSTQGAVSRVLAALNMLRGTIAHCGMLADDEVDRLQLAIRDWFRVLEGPRV